MRNMRYGFPVKRHKKVHGKWVKLGKKRGRKHKFLEGYKTIRVSGMTCKGLKGRKGIRGVNSISCTSEGKRLTGSSLRCDKASKMGGVGFCHMKILHFRKRPTGIYAKRGKKRSYSGKVGRHPNDCKCPIHR